MGSSGSRETLESLVLKESPDRRGSQGPKDLTGQEVKKAKLLWPNRKATLGMPGTQVLMDRWATGGILDLVDCLEDLGDKGLRAKVRWDSPETRVTLDGLVPRVYRARLENLAGLWALPKASVGYRATLESRVITVFRGYPVSQVTVMSSLAHLDHQDPRESLG